MYGLHRSNAVKDPRGITHEVVFYPIGPKDWTGSAGFTMCETLFFLEGTRTWPLEAVKMTESVEEITCMACIAVSAKYPEARE